MTSLHFPSCEIPHQPTAETTLHSTKLLSRTRAFLIPLLVALMAILHVYRSPRDVAGVEISPDEVEYAVGAQRLATVGRYDISIEGKSLPPRYTPWFSILLAPVYYLWPDQIGAGIIVVLGFAALAAIIAYLLGRQLAARDGASELAGILAAAAVVTLGSFDIAARFIMTDVPAAALWLMLGWIYVAWEISSPGEFLETGNLIALAVAIRPTSLWLLVPFAFRHGMRKPLKSWLALLCPAALILLAQAAYQHIVFGHALRSGYQVWCPIPYDFPSQVFSLSYIAENLRMLDVYAPILLLGTFAAALLARRNIGARRLLAFVSLAVLPLSVMHLVYFTAASRFYLPLLSIAAILAAVEIASLLPIGKIASGMIAVTVMIFVALLPPPRMIDSPGVAQLVRDNFLRATPNNAVILTAQDLVWMEPAARSSRRQFIPLTRAQEYASKRLAYQPLIKPEEFNNPLKTKAVVEYAVEDDPTRIARWLESNSPVYLDVSGIDYGATIIRSLLERYTIRSMPGRIDLWQITGSR